MSLDRNTKAQLDALVDKFDDRIESAIDRREIEAKKNNFYTSGSSSNATLKREWHGVQDVFNKKTLEHTIEFKDMTIGGQTGDVVGEDNGGLKNIQRNYLNIAELMPNVNLSNDSGEYRYIVNSAETNNFDGVAEGSASAESSLAFTEKSARPENIRSHFLASREIADDIGGFQNFVQQRGLQMLIDQMNGQILNGNGTSPALNGLTLGANRTSYDYTASNPYYQAVASPQEIDVLISAINILLISGYNADMILVNPKQFGKFSFLKSSQNEYLKNDNFRIVNSFTANINGVPVYACSKVADDQFYVADSSKAFALVRKGGLDLRVTSEGTDLFKKNLVMMELQARIQTLPLNPSATLYGDFSESITALTSS